MDNKFNFSSKFKVANIFSLILFTASILFILFKGLNYGIDFKGGTLIELRASNTSASKIRSALNNMDLGDVNVKKFGQEGDYLINPINPKGNKFHLTIEKDGQRKTGEFNRDDNDEILVIGGSFSQGWGVNDEDTFSSKISTPFTCIAIINISFLCL